MNRRKQVGLLGISRMLLGLMGLAVALISGCVTTGPQEGSAVPLEPIQAVQFTDVPVPRDFVLVPSRSWSYETASFRLCDMVYSGRTGVEPVSEFYKTQMAMRGWKFKDEMDSLGVRTLNFTRADEKCNVSMKRERDQTILTISIRK